MPEDNEKVEDFISLWKKKMETENNNRPSVIGETMNKIDVLQRENQDLRQKIAENVQLIERTEEILKKAAQEKEQLKIEKEQSLQGIKIRMGQIEAENEELSKKVKSMVQLVMEKDQEINDLHNSIADLQKGAQNEVNIAIIEELKAELTKYKNHITDLEREILEKKNENEDLQKQLVEKMKALPVDYVVPVENTQPTVIKPNPPENRSLPLETLCQDLQSDLNKYKKIIDKLKQEKSELKTAMESKGVNLEVMDLQKLQQENETLKKDLSALQDQINVAQTTQKSSTESNDQKITELELKLQEKDKIITELKLNQIEQKEIPAGPMAGLVDDLQKNINKLKLTIKEKDKKIEELSKLSGL
ncbi:MAG: hypothetical protein EU552_02490 [Promethearchaeota archaeon]|nr:MAG: hypothetical protein EU552_02490 [Candidatus Lokiarchaeota archaeon]